MWYYESNGQSSGPVSKGVIAQTLSSGTIDLNTLVCKQGSTTWQPLGDTELITLLTLPQTADSPHILPPILTNVSLPQLNRTFWWWVGLAGFSLFGNILLIATGEFNYRPGLFVLINLPLLAACVFEYVMISMHWKVVQDGEASLSPGKAVGNLFIPAFALYWLFPAHYGLVKEQNRFIMRHFDPSAVVGVRKPIHWITLTYLILYWLVWAFLLFISVFTIIYNNSYYYSPYELTFYNDTISNIILVLFLVQMVARWVMLVDHYLTSRSILQK